MYDHRDSIQAATHKLLSKWLSEQQSRQEAYMVLQAGLKRAQMNQLASNLRIWVEGTGVLPQMMDESKWIKQRLSKWMIVLKELKINWYT